MLPDWEIWLDNHISSIVTKWLQEAFDLQVKSAYALKLYTIGDYEFYKRAKQYGKVIIITKDSDLEEIISKKGSPPKLINLKFGNCDNRILFSILSEHIERVLKLLIDFDKILLI